MKNIWFVGRECLRVVSEVSRRSVRFDDAARNLHDRLRALQIIGIFFAGLADAAPTNLWQAGTGVGKWEYNVNWNQGVPSLNHGLHLVRPTGGLDALATVDAATVASNLLNSCMNVSNVTVQGTSGGFGNFATLALNNTLNAPSFQTLSVLSNLNINFRGSVTITNSRLVVGVLNAFGGIINNGFLLLNSGELISSNGVNIIGSTGSGEMRIQAGTWRPRVALVGSLGQGKLWLTGGELITTNHIVPGGTAIYHVEIGTNGQMIVSNGTWHASSVNVHGTLTIAGGQTTLWDGGLAVDGFYGGNTSTLWMTGGRLTATGGSTFIGFGGQIIVSNGVWRPGTVGIQGGGTLTVSGPQVIVTNDSLYVGYTDALQFKGQFNLTDGKWLSSYVSLGEQSNELGQITMTGGELVVSNLIVGNQGTGTAAINGGQLRASSMNVALGTNSHGSIVVASGQFRAGSLSIASGFFSQATLTTSGGVSVVTSNVTVGDCPLNAYGVVAVRGGSVFVTNASHDAALDVRHGWVFLSGGQLKVDKLVMTNECGFFYLGGGSLTYGELVLAPNLDADGDGLPNGWEQTYGLDPLSISGINGYEGDPDGDGVINYDEYLAGTNPIVNESFRITGIAREANSIRVSWLTPVGKTNVLERTAGGAGGSYITNGFAAIFTINGTSSTSTNYLDVNAATNFPARYYRVRLVP